MISDDVSAQERLRLLQPKQNCGWRCFFSRFRKSKQKKLHKMESPFNNVRKVNVWILQRKAGESFWIGDDIQIVVFGSFTGVTHLGIEAPPEIRIVKGECKHKEQFH